MNDYRKIAAVLCVLAFGGSAYAELHLDKVDNWSARVLPGAQGIWVRPAQGVFPTIVVSWNEHLIHASLPNGSEDIFGWETPSAADSIYDVVLGNFDSDGKLEIALITEDRSFRTFTGVLDFGSDTFSFSTRTVELDVGKSESVYTENIIHDACYSCATSLPLFPVLLRSGDFDSDGSDNLLTSFGWNVRTNDYGFVFDEDWHGRATLWEGPPGGAKIWQVDAPVSFFKFLTNSLNLAVLYSHFFHGLGPDVSGGSSRLGIWSSDLSRSYLPLAAINPDTCPPPPHDPVYVATQGYLLSGNVDTNSDDVEVILCQSASGWSICSFNRYYEMFTVRSDGTASSIWQSPNEQFQDLKNFTLHPDRPGRFMGINSATKKLNEFDGSTGFRIAESADTVPSGIRGWFDIFGDSSRYLLATHDSVAEIYTVGLLTGANDDESSRLPEKFALTVPYPNPFNPTVKFTVALPKKAQLSVEVFDLLGRPVANIYNGTVSAGALALEWSPKGAASGVYFLRAKVDDNASQTRKVVLLK